jgi:hypothetical protein
MLEVDEPQLLDYEVRLNGVARSKCPFAQADAGGKGGLSGASID